MGKKRLAATIVTLALLTCFAVGQAAKTKVTIGTYSAVRFKVMTETLLPEWKKAYPDIELDIQMYPDFFNKLLVLMGTDAAPDIVDTAGTYLFGHVIRGGAVDLAPYMERDKTFNKNDWYPHTWEEVRFPHDTGKGIYALPYNWVGGVMYYNLDYFDKSGLRYPTDNWTWEDLRLNAKKLTLDANGDGIKEVWGTVVDSAHLIFDPIIRCFGGQVLTPDRSKAVLNTQEAANALQFLTRFTLEDESAPTTLSASFEAGQTAVHIKGSWEVERIPQDGRINWSAVVGPGGPVKRDVYGGSNSWEVMKRPNQNMDAVWTVLKELVSTRTVRAFITFLGRELPARRSQAREWPQATLIRTLAASAPYARNADFSIDWSPWQTVKRNEITPVLQGTRSVNEGLARAETAINGVLEAARKK